MCLAQRMHFLYDMLQMTLIVFVSVINYYHINGLHLFWDSWRSASKSPLDTIGQFKTLFIPNAPLKWVEQLTSNFSLNALNSFTAVSANSFVL